MTNDAFPPITKIEGGFSYSSPAFKGNSDCHCSAQDSQADKIFKEFQKFKMSGDFTDFTIEIRGKEFDIHKMVFAAQSSVFKQIFMENTGKVSKELINIENFSEETFELFLDFFYTGRVDAAANPVELFELASEFDVQEARTICIERILETLDESNAVDVFNIAHRHSSIVLKKKSFEIIKAIFPRLGDTFINKLDEINDLVALKARMDAILKMK